MKICDYGFELAFQCKINDLHINQKAKKLTLQITFTSSWKSPTTPNQNHAKTVNQ